MNNSNLNNSNNEQIDAQIRAEFEKEKLEVLRLSVVSLLNSFIENFDIRLLEIVKNNSGVVHIFYESKKITEIHLGKSEKNDDEAMEEANSSFHIMQGFYSNFEPNKSFMSIYTLGKDTSTPTKYYTPNHSGYTNTQIEYKSNLLSHNTSIKKSLFQQKDDSDFFVTKSSLEIRQKERPVLAHYNDSDIIQRGRIVEEESDEDKGKFKCQKSLCTLCLIF